MMGLEMVYPLIEDPPKVPRHESVPLTCPYGAPRSVTSAEVELAQMDQMESNPVLDQG